MIPHTSLDDEWDDYFLENNLFKFDTLTNRKFWIHELEWKLIKRKESIFKFVYS